MKKTVKPLSLRRETLRQLNAVIGGGFGIVTRDSCVSACYVCPQPTTPVVCPPIPPSLVDPLLCIP